MSNADLADRSGLAVATVTNAAHAKYRPFGRPRAESLANALELPPADRESILAAFDQLDLAPWMKKSREENAAARRKTDERSSWTVRGILVAAERSLPETLTRAELLQWLETDTWRKSLKTPPRDAPLPGDLVGDPTDDLMEPSHPVALAKNGDRDNRPQAIRWKMYLVRLLIGSAFNERECSCSSVAYCELCEAMIALGLGCWNNTAADTLEFTFPHYNDIAPGGGDRDGYAPSDVPQMGEESTASGAPTPADDFG